MNYKATIKVDRPGMAPWERTLHFAAPPMRTLERFGLGTRAADDDLEVSVTFDPPIPLPQEDPYA